MTATRGRLRTALALGLAAVATAGLLAACGSDDEDVAAPSPTTAAPTTSAAPADGPFSFTDDKGKTVTLPAKPKRIVVQSALGAGLWEFGVRPVGVFGPQKLADGTQDPQSGNLDLTTVTSVGQTYGEFEVEKLATLKPDLVITTIYSDLLWYVPEEAQAKIEKIAPIIGIKLEAADIATGVEKIKVLAAALGADVNTEKVTTDKAAFDTASTAFSTAVKAKPDLEVVPVSGFADNFYVGDPTYLGGLKTYVALGLQVPAAKGEGGAYEELSWEQVARYPADLFLQDSRDPANVKVFDTKATWKALPAVKAGAVVPWNPELPFSYSIYAAEMTRLAGVFTAAKTDVVP